MTKILFIRLSSIGDIVLTTPAIRCLKQQLPEVVLHYLVKPQFSAILEANPYIDYVYCLSPRLADTLQMLRAEEYDCIIDLHHNLRSQLIKLALWRVPSVSFRKLNLKKWLLTQFKIDCLPDVHIVDRYMSTLARWGIRNDGVGLNYFIPPQYEVAIAQRFPHTAGKPYLAIVVGAAHATKQLPTDKLLSLCRSVDQPIILIGGQEDAEKGNYIAQQAGQYVVSACGQLHLHESASVIKQAAYVVTPDTGLMHIAAALGKRIISVWGNTVPKFGMYPYLPAEGSQIFEVEGLACRPCSKIGHQQCPKGHFNCMNQQDMRSVADVLSN